MIFAAGLGTRLRPLTNTMPKALVKVNGMPLLEIIIRRLKWFGFNRIIINVHHFPKQIIQFLEEKQYFNTEIAVSDETDLLLDTGGGITKAAWFFDNNEPFLVHNVDILCDLNLADLYDFHRQNKSLATLAVKTREASRVFLFNEKMELCGWKNRQTKDTIISKGREKDLTAIPFSGIHVISPEIFDKITETGVFSIVDVYLRLAKKHRIIAYPHEKYRWMDVGRPEQLEKAPEVLEKMELG